jgi:glycosyltransferase involved in cell wall biosynthesis
MSPRVTKTNVATWRRRPQQIAAVLRRDGVRVLAGKLLGRTATSLLSGAQPFDIPLPVADVLAPPVPETLRPETLDGIDRPLVINVVASTPDEQSGGIGTLMRCISLLEGRGHDCRVYIHYTGERRDLERHREIARQRFPHVQARFDDAAAGMRPADVIMATAWPTAYVVRAAASAGARFYFVQDFEPSFYAMGSEAVLAEDTYRFGFHGITAGRWLAGKLPREYGMSCDSFDLGVDLGTYQLDPDAERDGVVFYARPDTARRGFELGMVALELFAQRHPRVPIHLIGQDVHWHRPSFDYISHGHTTPAELAAIYNRSVAGLVLSLTNLSLLPAELLAAGCIPVMNDAECTRASFDNPYTKWSDSDPRLLADALCEVVEAPERAETAAKAASSVGPLSWDLVADQLEAGLHRGLRRAVASATR